MKKAVKTQKASAKKKHAPPEVVDAVRSPEPSTLSGNTFSKPPRRAPKGTGSEFAGQSGDLQDLSRNESADSESVEELVAEGQYREAEIIGAVEDADDPDKGEVRTREVRQDDVPTEYIDND